MKYLDNTMCTVWMHYLFHSFPSTCNTHTMLASPGMGTDSEEKLWNLAHSRPHPPWKICFQNCCNIHFFLAETVQKRIRMTVQACCQTTRVTASDCSQLHNQDAQYPHIWMCSVCFTAIQCGTKTGASFFFSFFFFCTADFFSPQTIFFFLHRKSVSLPQKLAFSWTIPMPAHPWENDILERGPSPPQPWRGLQKVHSKYTMPGHEPGVNNSPSLN